MIRVYLNEQHTLLPSQIEALQAFESEYTILPVPANGWTLQEMANEANCQRAHIGAKVCFASPIPALLGWLCSSAQKNHQAIYVLHNDNRIAREIIKPDGSKQVIHTIAPDGWELVRVA